MAYPLENRLVHLKADEWATLMVEKMDRSSVKEAGVQSGAGVRAQVVFLRLRGPESHLLDKGDKPGVGVEELVGGPKLPPRSDDDVTEEMEPRAG